MADGGVEAARLPTRTDRIEFLGHSTALIELDGVRLLTDPLLRGRVAHLRREVPLPRRTAWASPDAVLVSHMHHDHLDPASLEMIGRDTPLLVPAGAGAWLSRRRFTDVTEMSIGDTRSVGAVTVTAVEARHDGRRALGGPRAVALGFLARGLRSVYFAGDTELFDEMAALSPDLDAALLPVAGWGPTLGAGHMGPLDAARAAALTAPRVAIPVHWGTLVPLGLANRHRPRLLDPPRLFAEHAARLAPAVEVVILMPGRELSLPPL